MLFRARQSLGVGADGRTTPMSELRRSGRRGPPRRRARAAVDTGDVEARVAAKRAHRRRVRQVRTGALSVAAIAVVVVGGDRVLRASSTAAVAVAPGRRRSRPAGHSERPGGARPARRGRAAAEPAQRWNRPRPCAGRRPVDRRGLRPRPAARQRRRSSPAMAYDRAGRASPSHRRAIFRFDRERPERAGPRRPAGRDPGAVGRRGRAVGR